jgi:hypothetical protein
MVAPADVSERERTNYDESDRSEHDAAQKIFEELNRLPNSSDGSFQRGAEALKAIPVGEKGPDGSLTYKYANGSAITMDKNGDITAVIPHNGDPTYFKRDANRKIVEMTDSRGKYVTADQVNWYKDVVRASHPADWRGLVTVSPTGKITETNLNGASRSINLDGGKTVRNAVGGTIVTNKEGSATEVEDAKGRKSKFEHKEDGKTITAQKDARGAFYSKDGRNWFNENNTTGIPDRVGTVSVNPETGMIEENFRSPDGNVITRWDLNGRKHVNEGTLRLEDFSDRAGKLFNKIDYDGNGVLTAAELGRAVQDADLVGKDAQVVAALHRTQAEFTAMRGSKALTREDIAQFKNLLVDKPDHKLVQNVQQYLWRTSAHQSHWLPTSLYADQKDPMSSISKDAIKQGTIGNCYFEAALSSVAGSRPHLIKDMVTDNKDGTATVTFGKDPARPIVVFMPTEAEKGLYSEPTSKGVWPQVIEKAHGQYLRRYGGKSALTPAEGADGGGQPKDVIELLTGDTAERVKVNQANVQAIQQELTNAFATRRSVTATIDKYAGQKATTSVDGYVNGHAYSIVGWNPSGPGGGTLTIRNPWGDEQAGKYGTFTMSMEQFSRNFNDMAFQKLRK